MTSERRILYTQISSMNQNSFLKKISFNPISYVNKIHLKGFVKNQFTFQLPDEYPLQYCVCQ